MSPKTPQQAPLDSELADSVLIPAPARDRPTPSVVLDSSEAPEPGSSEEKAATKAFLSPRERPVCEG